MRKKILTEVLSNGQEANIIENRGGRFIEYLPKSLNSRLYVYKNSFAIYSARRFRSGVLSTTEDAIRDQAEYDEFLKNNGNLGIFIDDYRYHTTPEPQEIIIKLPHGMKILIWKFDDDSKMLNFGIGGTGQWIQLDTSAPNLMPDSLKNILTALRRKLDTTRYIQIRNLLIDQGFAQEKA